MSSESLTKITSNLEIPENTKSRTSKTISNVQNEKIIFLNKIIEESMALINLLLGSKTQSSSKNEDHLYQIKKQIEILGKISKMTLEDNFRLKQKYKELTKEYKIILNEIKTLNSQLDSQEIEIKKNKKEISRLEDLLVVQKNKVSELSKNESQYSFLKSSIQSINNFDTNNQL